MRKMLLLSAIVAILGAATLPARAQDADSDLNLAVEDELLDKNIEALRKEGISLYFANDLKKSKSKLEEALTLADKGLEVNSKSVNSMRNRAGVLIWLAFIDGKQGRKKDRVEKWKQVVSITDATFKLDPKNTRIPLTYAYAVRNYIWLDKSLSAAQKLDLLNDALNRFNDYKFSESYQGYADFQRGRLLASKALILRGTGRVSESVGFLNQAVFFLKEAVKLVERKDGLECKLVLAWALLLQDEWLLKQKEYNSITVLSNLNYATELCKEVLEQDPKNKYAKFHKLHAEVLSFKVKEPRTNNSSQLKEAARSK